MSLTGNIPVFEPPTPEGSKKYMEGVVPMSPSILQQLRETGSLARRLLGSGIATAVGLPLAIAEGGINLAANAAALPSTAIGYPLAKGINTFRTRAHKTLAGSEQQYHQAA